MRVTIEKIVSLHELPGSKNLERAEISRLGFASTTSVVVPKEYRVGDLVAHFHPGVYVPKGLIKKLGLTEYVQTRSATETFFGVSSYGFVASQSELRAFRLRFALGDDVTYALGCSDREIQVVIDPKQVAAGAALSITRHLARQYGLSYLATGKVADEWACKHGVTLTNEAVELFENEVSNG